MRHPRVPARLPAWARTAALATALVAAGSGLAPGAAAQEKFDRLFVFGDSYADLTLGNPLATGQPGLSLWNVYPIALAEKLKILTSIDFAVGGATATPLGSPALPPFWNLPQQVDAFDPTLTKFDPRDLVTINIGGNDIRAMLGNSPSSNKAIGYPEEALSPLNAKLFADQTVLFVKGDIDRLVQAGAKTFMLGQFSSISGLPELQANLANLPPDIASLVAAGADAYAKAYFDGMHTALLPHAQSGTRFFVLDLARLGNAVNADPAKYGFTGGFLCPKNGVVDRICGATLANPTNDNPLQYQYYFGPDGLHLTNGGFDLVARYMANILMAPDTIAVQPGLVTTTAGGFTQSLLGRLDGTREAKAGGPVTAYAMGSFLGGDRSGSADLVGYDYESKSGTAGIEYSINRSLILGIAANSTITSADLSSGANIELEAIQAAAYLAYATKQAFAEIVATYGSHDVGLVRPGVLELSAQRYRGQLVLSGGEGRLPVRSRRAPGGADRGSDLHSHQGRRLYREGRRAAHLQRIGANPRTP